MAFRTALLQDIARPDGLPAQSLPCRSPKTHRVYCRAESLGDLANQVRRLVARRIDQRALVPFDHCKESRNCPFRHLNAELPQLTMTSRCTPTSGGEDALPWAL